MNLRAQQARQTYENIILTAEMLLQKIISSCFIQLWCKEKQEEVSALTLVMNSVRLFPKNKI